MLTKKQENFLKTIKHGGINSFYRRAFELGVDVREIGSDKDVIRLKYKIKSVYMRRQTIPVNKRLGGFTRNKMLTKSILADAGIRVPRGGVIMDMKDIRKIVAGYKIKYPLIVKPQNGTRAKGVTWNVKNPKELEAAAKVSFKQTKGPALIEEMFIGNEYRVLVFNNKILSAVQKIAAGITGDGKSTIQELIEKFDENRNPGFKINIDKIAKDTIKGHRYTMSTILKKGYFLQLRHNLNMSDGGRCINQTRATHPYYKEICKKATSVLGLQFGGVDILAKDIRKPGPYVILEVNPNPYFNMHELALVEGKPVDVSEAIMLELFPKIKKS
jgi:cyanophycin synthetase